MFQPYLNTYYVPYSTYQPPQAVPLVPLNALANVQAGSAVKAPHDCTKETKELKDRLDLLERLLRPATPQVPVPQGLPQQPSAAPVAPPQPPAAPQQVALDGAAIFQGRCLKCHSKTTANEELAVEGKPRKKGGGIVLEAMTPTQILVSIKQIAADKMPMDAPLQPNEKQALLGYLLALKPND